jgi:hypothetical protein
MDGTTGWLATPEPRVADLNHYAFYPFAPRI